jgi:hypothetical protein
MPVSIGKVLQDLHSPTAPAPDGGKMLCIGPRKGGDPADVQVAVVAAAGLEVSPRALHGLVYRDTGVTSVAARDGKIDLAAELIAGCTAASSRAEQGSVAPGAPSLSPRYGDASGGHGSLCHSRSHHLMIGDKKHVARQGSQFAPVLEPLLERRPAKIVTRGDSSRAWSLKRAEPSRRS